MRIKRSEKSNSVLGGLFWSFGERITAQLVTTIVTIILARLLDPTHYGIISIVTIFVTFCNIFVSGGLGSAVVQKKDPTSDDFNTAFVLSFSVSIILYIALFFLAPVIAKFYNMPELTAITRVMGIRLIIASINTIQHAYIQKQMKFKKFFFATLFGTVISAFVGLYLAYRGYGVWALVAQYLTNTTIDTIVLLFVGGWVPDIVFKLENAKRLFSFGWKVLVTEFIYTLEGDIRSLIVGKVFGSADLAFYDQGKKYPSLFVNNLNSSINKVMLPAYSKNQDNLDLLKQMLRKSIKVGIYLLAPLLIGFALVSKNFVTLVLTEKWLNAVPYIQIFCIIFLTRPLETSCHQALLAIGDSGIVMKIMIAINVFALITVLIAVFVFRSVFLIAIGSLLSTLVSISLFMYMTYRKIGYKPKEQLSDIYPVLLTCIIMGIVVYVIGIVISSPIISLILQVIIGFGVYIFISHIMGLDGYKYIMQKLFKNKKGQTNVKDSVDVL